MSKAKAVPRLLYKYCPINKYTSDMFCQGVIWLSSPKCFNDPYDCKPVYEEMSENEKKELCKIQLKHETPRMASDEIDEAVEVKFTKEDCDRLVTERIRILINKIDSTRIFCTSELYKSVVMWSHYADVHRGICIEFDTSKIPEGTSFHIVNYEHERPSIHLLRDLEILGKKTVSFKSREWAYEKEWRMVLLPLDNCKSCRRELSIDPGLITGIIFGEQISDDDLKRVIAWCRPLKLQPKLYTTSLDDKLFQINRTPIDYPPEE